MNDRRRERRTPGDRLQRIEARVRPGHRVKVIDLSTRGALIEGQRPFHPGSRIVFHMHSDHGHTSVSARVVRCLVAALHAEDGVTYRAGLSFEEPVPRVSETSARDEYQVPSGGEIQAESGGDKLPEGNQSSNQRFDGSMK